MTELAAERKQQILARVTPGKDIDPQVLHEKLAQVNIKLAGPITAIRALARKVIDWIKAKFKAGKAVKDVVSTARKVEKAPANIVKSKTPAEMRSSIAAAVRDTTALARQGASRSMGDLTLKEVGRAGTVAKDMVKNEVKAVAAKIKDRLRSGLKARLSYGT